MTDPKRTILSTWIVRWLVAVGIVACTFVTIIPAVAQEVLGRTGVTGAGSTFVYPVLSRWSREYRQQRARGGTFPTPDSGLDDPPADTALSYEPIGSLGGLLRVKDRAVDFAACDMPLESRELSTQGLAQFPIVLGGVVVAVNIDGVGPGEIRFTGPLLADVFLGKIHRWSDPAIRALNPSLKLPEAGIVVVHRAEGSGTTFNFADYLSKVSPVWKAQVGAALIVRWPTGTAAKGNEGVAQTVSHVKNSIGYVEFAQAMQAKLAYAVIQNHAGRFVRPEAATFQAAAAGADWKSASEFSLVLTDARGEQAYPITVTVFALMPKSARRASTHATLAFFHWSLDNGSRAANQLGYVPLPASLIRQVKEYWAVPSTTGPDRTPSWPGCRLISPSGNGEVWWFHNSGQKRPRGCPARTIVAASARPGASRERSRVDQRRHRAHAGGRRPARTERHPLDAALAFGPRLLDR